MMAKKENSLPKGWKNVRLGDFVHSAKGKKPKNHSKELTATCNIPYIDIDAFDRDNINSYTDGVGCVECKDTDFLMVWDGSRSGYVGKGMNGALGSTLVRLDFKDVFDKYAYYFLQSKYQLLNTRAKGSGTPHVDPHLLWNFELLIPPLEIQHRIVEKIDTLFSELDNSVANLKAAKAQLKRYRQSVLKSAFEGKLTAAWREMNGDKLETVGLLMERIKAEREAAYVSKSRKPKELQTLTADEIADLPELPEGWRWDYLGHAIFSIEAGKSFKCDERIPRSDEIGVAKVSAVTWGEYDEKESKTCINLEKVNPDYYIRTNDFLLSRANTIELVGASVIAKNVTQKVMLSDKTLRMKFSTVSDYYVLYYLRSRYGRDEIESLSTGNQESMRNIGQDRIHHIRFPFCSTEEQYQIVNEIESRLSEADVMERTIDESLIKAEKMRQSILKKAFEGKLVTQKDIT